jgi:hypothetical protein
MFREKVGDLFDTDREGVAVILLPPGFQYPKPRVVFGAAAESGTNATGYNFTSLACGNPAGGRKIIVITLGRTPTVSACSINGSAAAKIAGFQQGASLLEIYGLEVPTGTTCTVDLAFNATAARAAVATYALYNASLVPISTPIQTGNGSGTSVSGNIAVKAGSAIIAGTARNAFGALSWTGLTEDSDVNVESGQDSFGTASGASTTDNASLGITATGSSGDDNALVAVAFGG